jgi:hypothetical protein
MEDHAFHRTAGENWVDRKAQRSKKAQAKTQTGTISRAALLLLLAELAVAVT